MGIFKSLVSSQTIGFSTARSLADKLYAVLSIFTKHLLYMGGSLKLLFRSEIGSPAENFNAFVDFLVFFPFFLSWYLMEAAVFSSPLGSSSLNSESSVDQAVSILWHTVHNQEPFDNLASFF